MPDGRVLVAFDDGPLVASPTWTRLDDTDDLIAQIDIQTGKQTLDDQTGTGTAVVSVNDTDGLFDPLNTLSPYFGKLDGKQILLQAWNPVTATWESQFRGTVRNYGYTPRDSQVVCDVQIECVDIFDYLNGYQLTPGIDGVTPPAGAEGTIFYAATAGTVDGRIIEILTDLGIDSTRWVVFTGNVSVQAVKYDPGESALSALRDAADAELPMIANLYVDRFGRFVFHGRESRFDPDTVAAGAGGAWDFNRWKVGDGAALELDSTRAQMRVLAYGRDRDDIVNSAICTPAGIAEADIPGQVFQDAASIIDLGLHALPPISDLIIEAGTTTGNSRDVECHLYAKLYVENRKAPFQRISTLTIKPVRPDGSDRAANTWAVLTQSDISDIVNVRVGYPGGVGIDDPVTPGNGMDNYIEGRQVTIRPLTPEYDYVETTLEISPAVWSMDTHGVFA